MLSANLSSQPHFLKAEKRTVQVGIDLHPQDVAVIVLSSFDVELEEGITQIPMLSIFTAGPFQSVMARAKDVQERIETVFDLMDRSGGFLFVKDDGDNPAVYWSDDTFHHWYRLITVYKGDAEAFGRANGNRELLASYFKAQIDAHYTLFWRISTDIWGYETLLLDETRDGLIYKEIFLRMKEYGVEKYRYVPFLNMAKDQRIEVLKDSLGRIELAQRKRLTLLGHIVPRDWK